MTSSNGNIFRVTGHLGGKTPVTCEFPAQRLLARGFGAFFDLRLNTPLSEQWRGWWFETPSSPLWCHCNDVSGSHVLHQYNDKICLMLQLLYSISNAELTHWGWVTHLCVSRLTITGLDNGLSPYLIQCWNIVNWTLGNKLQWNFNRNSNIFIEENTFENVVYEILFILSRPQCVKHRGTTILVFIPSR